MAFEVPIVWKWDFMYILTTDEIHEKYSDVVFWGLDLWG
jgi:hypothetical protein